MVNAVSFTEIRLKEYSNPLHPHFVEALIVGILFGYKAKPAPMPAVVITKQQGLQL